MKKKYYLTLDDEFIQYCELNNITDIDKKAIEVFNVGFNITKYGMSPRPISSIGEKQIKHIDNKKDSLYD